MITSSFLSVHWCVLESSLMDLIIEVGMGWVGFIFSLIHHRARIGSMKIQPALHATVTQTSTAIHRWDLDLMTARAHMKVPHGIILVFLEDDWRPHIQKIPRRKIHILHHEVICRTPRRTPKGSDMHLGSTFMDSAQGHSQTKRSISSNS